MTTGAALSVVVEGSTDVVILRSILGQDLAASISFYAGQGRMSLASIGRNILFDEGGPLVLALDSESLNPEHSKEKRLMNEYLLKRMASPEDFKVIVFHPEIEVIFFEAPLALGRLLGQQISEDFIRQGLLIPKHTLDKLLAEASPKRDYDSFVGSIDPESAAELASGKQAAALVDAVKSFLTPAVLAAS
jgi:hypothetical protein